MGFIIFSLPCERKKIHKKVFASSLKALLSLLWVNFLHYSIDSWPAFGTIFRITVGYRKVGTSFLKRITVRIHLVTLSLKYPPLFVGVCISGDNEQRCGLRMFAVRTVACGGLYEIRKKFRACQEITQRPPLGGGGGGGGRKGFLTSSVLSSAYFQQTLVYILHNSIHKKYNSPFSSFYPVKSV
jgi:hypothetical protein